MAGAAKAKSHPGELNTMSSGLQAIENKVGDIKQALGNLQSSFAAMQATVREGHEDHRQIVAKFAELERRVDRLVIVVETTNTQLAEIILYSRKKHEEAEDERQLLADRVSGLEQTETRRSERESERKLMHDAEYKRSTVHLNLFNAFLACMMLLVTFMQFWNTFHPPQPQKVLIEGVIPSVESPKGAKK